MGELHCWADKGEYLAERYGRFSPRHIEYVYGDPDPDTVRGATCFLEAGHDGPHEWTEDSEITITFAEDKPKGDLNPC